MEVSPEVERALRDHRPVVALETTLVTHGFAPPSNVDIALRMCEVVRENGAVPAIIGIVRGKAHIGLNDAELKALADNSAARKVSNRDLAIALGQCATGGTTVAATAILAHRAGIQVFATGGIGGVHRGHPEDVSADLVTLAATPIVVVCAGAKSILDLPKTLEYLETHGVPVVGYGTDEFPAFYSRRSGLRVDARADNPADVARMVAARDALDLHAAVLVCAPCPELDELPFEEAETAIAQAVAEAEVASIGGKALTPFLLARLVELTGGQSQRANEALLRHNASVAAHIARMLAGSSR
ncbi:MAG: pseudouridine-5'-phosphate glycosidase [Chloroflexi bacterium]|nr:pseudouridine-5'-phosphate glycosidase [Chloroflexota bacterium]